MTGPDHLARMAEQIAANLATAPDPAAAVADHITKFWTRAMIADLRRSGVALGPVVAAALARLPSDG